MIKRLMYSVDMQMTCVRRNWGVSPVCDPLCVCVCVSTRVYRHVVDRSLSERDWERERERKERRSKTMGKKRSTIGPPFVFGHVRTSLPLCVSVSFAYAGSIDDRPTRHVGARPDTSGQVCLCVCVCVCVSHLHRPARLTIDPPVVSGHVRTSPDTSGQVCARVCVCVSFAYAGSSSWRLHDTPQRDPLERQGPQRVVCCTHR